MHEGTSVFASLVPLHVSHMTFTLVAWPPHSIGCVHMRFTLVAWSPSLVACVYTCSLSTLSCMHSHDLYFSLIYFTFFRRMILSSIKFGPCMIRLSQPSPIRSVQVASGPIRLVWFRHRPSIRPKLLHVFKQHQSIRIMQPKFNHSFYTLNT